jgi:hypothetical protein
VTALFCWCDFFASFLHSFYLGPQVRWSAFEVLAEAAAAVAHVPYVCLSGQLARVYLDRVVKPIAKDAAALNENLNGVLHVLDTMFAEDKSGATDSSRLLDDFAGSKALRSELCEWTRRAVATLEALKSSGASKDGGDGAGSGSYGGGAAGAVLPSAVVRRTALDRLRRFVLLFGIVHDSEKAEVVEEEKGEHEEDQDDLDGNDDNDDNDGHHNAVAEDQDQDDGDGVIDICGTTSPTPTSTSSGSGSGSHAPAGDKDKTAGESKKALKVKRDSNNNNSAASKPLAHTAGPRQPSETKAAKSMGKTLRDHPSPDCPEPARDAQYLVLVMHFASGNQRLMSKAEMDSEPALLEVSCNLARLVSSLHMLLQHVRLLCLVV